MLRNCQGDSLLRRDNGTPLEIIIYEQGGFDISDGLVITGMAKRIKDEVEPDSSESAVGA